MADLDDIELLESGALDLTGSDFRNADLRNRDLNGRNFTRCKMDGAKLEGAILTGCVFDHAKLTSIVAHQADLSSSTFMGSIV